MHLFSVTASNIADSAVLRSIALYGAETWDTLSSRSETPGKL
jgi:hypothetical protein